MALDDVGMQKLQALMMLPLMRLNQPFEQVLSELAGSALLIVSTFLVLLWQWLRYYVLSAVGYNMGLCLQQKPSSLILIA